MRKINEKFKGYDLLNSWYIDYYKNIGWRPDRFIPVFMRVYQIKKKLRFLTATDKKRTL